MRASGYRPLTISEMRAAIIEAQEGKPQMGLDETAMENQKAVAKFKFVTRLVLGILCCLGGTVLLFRLMEPNKPPLTAEGCKAICGTMGVRDYSTEGTCNCNVPTPPKVDAPPAPIPLILKNQHISCSCDMSDIDDKKK